MNIGIFGIGAIGSVIVHTLSINKELKLYYFNRSEISSIKVQLGDRNIKFPISINTVLPKQEKLDWIIICLKAYHFDNAISDIARLASDKTKIAIIQNGIKTSESYQSYFKKSQLLEVSIDCPTEPTANGFYKQYYSAKITLPNNPMGKLFGNLFLQENCTLYLKEDFKSFSWKKVCESSALGGIMCLSGNTARIFKDSAVLDLYRKLLEESIAVARADGANIAIDFIEKMLFKAQQYEDQKGSSMLTDRLSGKPIEWEARNGVIVKLGEKYRIPVPMNKLICTLLKQVNA